MTGADRSGGEASAAPPVRSTPRKRRWLKRLVLWPLALVTVLLVTVFAALYTEGGTRIVVRGVERALSDRLSIETVEGKLASQIILRDVRFASAPHYVSLTSVILAWRPSALIQSRLHIERAAVDGVEYLGPSPPPDQSVSEPPELDINIELPVEVQIDLLEIVNLRAQQGDDAAAAVVIDRLSASDVLAARTARIGALAVEAMGGSVSAKGELGLQVPNPVSLEFNWVYALTNGATANGKGTANGALRAIELAHALEITPAATDLTPLVVAIDGAAELARGATYPHVDLSLSWRNLRLPLDSPAADFASRSGRLRIKGKPEALTVDLIADAELPGLPVDVASLKLEGGIDPTDPIGTARFDLDWSLVPGAAASLGTGRIAGSGTVRSDGAVLEIVHKASTPFEVDLAARLERRRAGTQFTVGNIENVDVRLDWHELRWPLSGTPEFESSKGTLSLAGKPEAFALELDADASSGDLSFDAIGVALTTTLDPARPLSTVQATIDWQAQPKPGGSIDVASISGRTELSVGDDGKRLTATHRSTTPFEVDIDASITRRSSDPAIDPADIESVSLDANWRELMWPLTGDAQYVSRDGVVGVTGTLDALTLKLDSKLSVAGAPVRSIGLDAMGSVQPQAPYPFELDASWRTALDDTLSGQAFDAAGAGRFRGDFNRVRLDHRLEIPFALATRGNVLLESDSPRLELEGDWKGLAWPPHDGAADTVASDQGRYTVSGPVDDLAITASANARGKGLPALEFDASAQIHPTGSPRLDVALRTLNGTASVKGSAEWSPAVEFDLALAAEALNPGLQWAGADGKLSLSARVTGAAPSGGPEIRLDLERLNGTLRGQPLGGSGIVALEGASLSARDFRVSSGANGIELNGDIGEQAALRFELDAPELSALWPGLRGAASGNGLVSGARDAPRIEATIDATGLGFDTFALQALSLRANVDSTDRQPSNVNIDARGIDVGGNKVDALDIDGSGTLNNHRLTLRLSAPQADLSTRLSGALDTVSSTWAGTLEALDANIKEVGGHALGRWSMPRPAAIEASPEAARAEPVCLAQSRAKVCVEGQWRAPSGLDGKLDVSGLSLAMAQPWLTPNLTVQGTLTATATATGQGDGLQAKAQANIRGTRVTFKRPDDSPIAFGLNRVDLDATYAGDSAEVGIRAELEGGGGVRGNAKLGPAGASGVRSLSGALEGGLPDLELIAALTDTVRDLKGRVELNANVSGSTTRPRLRGGLRIVETSALVPDAGIRVAPVNLSLTGDGGERIQLKGEARSGEGTLRFSGAVRLDPDRGWPSSLRVDGERFEAAKLPNVELLVSPALDIEIDPKALDISGTVKVPQATIVIDEVPPSAVNLSSDEVIVRNADGTAPKAREARTGNLPAKLDVEVLLGDAVTFEGFGLLTRLTGQLRFRQLPGQPPSALGELSLVDGTYKAYGQDLAIERGRLIFSGPLDNPGLDMRATRTSGAVIAGIELKGSVGAIESRLFSNPALSQAETLSYLLTGGPLSGASQGQGALLAQAAFALGVSNSNTLTAEIANAFGLDDLSVVGSDVDTAGVQIGKRLGERLYARYAIGLFDTLGSLLVTYKLTDSLSLEAQTGQTQGLDLIYSIERESLFGGSKKSE